MFLVFLAWLIRARIYHVHQNFLVEIAAMDILEDHSLRKVGRDSYSCFERIELSNIIACDFLLWTHVWDSWFFYLSLILFTQCFQQHCAPIFLLPCNLCVLGIHTCRCGTKIITTLLSESSNRIVHFEVWIKKRLNNGRISRLLVGRDEHAPRTLVLHGGFNFKHCAEWPFHSEQVTYA